MRINAEQYSAKDTTGILCRSESPAILKNTSGGLTLLNRYRLKGKSGFSATAVVA
jgi:hypothetical protein